MTRKSFVLGAGLLLGACTAGPPATTPSAAPATAGAGGTEGAPASVPISTPRPTPTPVAGVGNCPIDSPLTVSQFMDADPACFGTADFEIRGWLDGPPDTGFEPPFIEPAWLYFPAPGLPALWTSRPVEPDHLCAPDAPTCNWFFLHVDPSSGLSLEIPPGELIVRGHIDDPAATTCHYVYLDDWTGERLDDADAVASCRSTFIVVAFRDAP